MSINSLTKNSRNTNLHLTATPYRTNPKEYFGNHIEMIVQAPNLSQLIQLGYLAPVKHYTFDLKTNFSKLKIGNDGDFDIAQISSVCQDPNYNQQIVTKFLEVCPTRKAICFAASVKQSKLLTQLFNNAGLICEHIDANTPLKKRRQIYQRFKIGITKVISNVGILTEGFDEPSIEAVILARPTRSISLLIQMCGRGLRLSPSTGKKDCLMMDFGGNFQRLGNINLDRKISLCPQQKQSEHLIIKHCPECHTQSSIFAQICLKCGYEFSSDEQAELSSDWAEELKAIFEDRPKKYQENFHLQLQPIIVHKSASTKAWRQFFWGLSISLTILSFYRLLG